MSIFYRAIYLQYAEAFAPYNPQLASELVWLYREMGGECPSSLQATPPALCNEYAQGLGMCFRTVDATGKDSLLALRSGGAWGHHHEDDASLQFFAFGQTLITDAGFGENGSLKALSGGHSRWTVKGIEPLNCLWNFTRGWLVDHEVAGRFPYAVAYSPVIMRRDTRQPIRIPIIHTRTVIQLAATSYLIIDAAESHLSQRVRFHIAGDAVQLVEQGIVANYPGHGHLAIRQLSPEFERCRISTCRPSGKSELVTTEACFVTGTSSQSVFLVTAFAEEATTPSVTLNTDGTYLIQSTEFSAHVCWAAPNAVAITDVATAETVHIKYRDIDSDVVVTTLAE